MSRWSNRLLTEIYQDGGEQGEGAGSVVVAAWLNGLRKEYDGYRTALHNNYITNAAFVYPSTLGEALGGAIAFVSSRSAASDGSREGVTFVQGANNNGNQVSSDWLVFDTGSTITTTAHTGSLLNIRHCTNGHKRWICYE